MSVLHLTLHKEFFDLIASGKKLEEYRTIKKHWISRLEGKTFDYVKFTNGYGSQCRSMMLECKGIRKGQGQPAWGAPLDEQVYIISLGRLVNV